MTQGIRWWRLRLSIPMLEGFQRSSPTGFSIMPGIAEFLLSNDPAQLKGADHFVNQTRTLTTNL